MLLVEVEVRIDPEHIQQLTADVQQVYAEIFSRLPGFVFGTMGIGRRSERLIGLWCFEDEQAWAQAQAVVEGTRVAVAASVNATLSWSEFDVVAHVKGPAAALLGDPAATGGRFEVRPDR